MPFTVTYQTARHHGKKKKKLRRKTSTIIIGNLSDCVLKSLLLSAIAIKRNIFSLIKKLFKCR